MNYFGHSSKEKEKSFEFVKSFYPNKDFDYYKYWRNNPGTYVFNHYEENVLKFTACYVSPRFNLILMPHETVFLADNTALADTWFKTVIGPVIMYDCGEIINLASTLKGHRFIEVLEDFNASVWYEQENFGADYTYFQVNPRHVNFYKKVLNGEQIGDIKTNHMGLPVALIRMNMKPPATTVFKTLKEADFAII